MIHHVNTILVPSNPGAVSTKTVPICENVECSANQGAEDSKDEDEACANSEYMKKNAMMVV